jgi:hypothetical protein
MAIFDFWHNGGNFKMAAKPLNVPQKLTYTIKKHGIHPRLIGYAPNVYTLSLCRYPMGFIYGCYGNMVA